MPLTCFTTAPRRSSSARCSTAPSALTPPPSWTPPPSPPRASTSCASPAAPRKMRSSSLPAAAASAGVGLIWRTRTSSRWARSTGAHTALRPPTHVFWNLQFCIGRYKHSSCTTHINCATCTSHQVASCLIQRGCLVLCGAVCRGSWPPRSRRTRRRSFSTARTCRVRPAYPMYRVARLTQPGTGNRATACFSMRCCLAAGGRPAIKWIIQLDPRGGDFSAS